MSELPKERTLKIILLGEVGSKIGINSFLLRYVNGSVTPSNKQTIGIDFLVKNMLEKDGSVTKLVLWKPYRGCDRFRSITAAYYRGSNIIFIMFDLTNRETYNRCHYWLEEVQKHIVVNSVEGPVIALIGTKCDIRNQRQVSSEEALKWATDNGINCYHETSAKENIGIDVAFNSAIDLVYKKQSNPLPAGSTIVDLHTKKKSILSCCC